MELSIDISPVLETSLAHREMRITKTSCRADSLLLSAIAAFSENFFISGPWTKTASSFIVKTAAVDITARLKKMLFGLPYRSSKRTRAAPTQVAKKAKSLMQLWRKVVHT